MQGFGWIYRIVCAGRGTVATGMRWGLRRSVMGVYMRDAHGRPFGTVHYDAAKQMHEWMNVNGHRPQQKILQVMDRACCKQECNPTLQNALQDKQRALQE
jgi:hypothetical protein